MSDNKENNSIQPINESKIRRVAFIEPIKLFDPENNIIVDAKKRKKNYYAALVEICKLLSLFLAFAALFYIAFMRKSTAGNAAGDAAPPDKEAAVLPESVTDDNKKEEVQNFVFSDESGKGIDPNKINTDGYTLAPIMNEATGVKIIVIHSHSSERVSETQGVAALGEELCKLLNGAGVESHHCTDKMDKNGVIGAYENMKARVKELLVTYPDTVCVIDLHNSDLGGGLTLTVGADDEIGWTENFRLALALSKGVARTYPHSLRVLPSAIGQDSGLLSLHVGIGSDKQSEAEAALALEAFANALITLCQ